MVADPGLSLGCDLELVEPRSGAFVRTWLARGRAGERQAAAAEPGRPRLANLIWTAKEAAAKARGEGLRLDVAPRRDRARVGAGGPTAIGGR